jgi:hypothetical protein
VAIYKDILIYYTKINMLIELINIKIKARKGFFFYIKSIFIMKKEAKIKNSNMFALVDILLFDNYFEINMLNLNPFT